MRIVPEITTHYDESHLPYVGPDRDMTVTNAIAGKLWSSFAGGASANINPATIFWTALDACPFGIILVEPLGHIVFANRRTERIFGYSRAELIGQAVDAIVHLNLRAQYADYHSHQLREAKRRKLLGLRKDGSEISVEVGLSSIQTDEGALVLAAIVDITNRLHIDRLKDDFVATVSHELRTPLTSISGALGLLINDIGKTVPKPMLRLLTIAHNSSQRLVRLVSSILDMEKIEAGKVVFAPKRIEVRSLVEQAIEAYHGFADTYGVRIKLDAASVAGEMHVDPDWLFQIVTNLLSNAVKFSPSDAEVVVAIEDRNGRIRISVRDHGHGVPEDFKGRIFEKFAQANTCDARQEGGTGLGLNIVRQIVTRLGGEVGFDDAPGGGAIFHVDFPGCESETATACELGPKPIGLTAMISGYEAQP
jgi:PAS domain S-box-containing protein